MNPHKEYSRKIRAEMELARANLAEFKTQPRSLTVEDRVQHLSRIEELERRVADILAQWQELEKARDDAVGGQMKSFAESTWRALQLEIHETITDVQS